MEEFESLKTPRTVGDFLTAPSKMPPIKAMAASVALIGVVFACVAAALSALKNVVGVSSIPLAVWGSFDFSAGWIVPLFAAVSVLCFAAAIAVLVVGRNSASFGVDLLGEAQRGVLSVMKDVPRFGISDSTDFSRVKLRGRYVAGCRMEAVEVWTARSRFTEDDFRGRRASEFGGVDVLLDGGRLLVFASSDAKRKWYEARSGGGRRG